MDGDVLQQPGFWYHGAGIREVKDAKLVPLTEIPRKDMLN